MNSHKGYLEGCSTKLIDNITYMENIFIITINPIKTIEKNLYEEAKLKLEVKSE